MRFSSPERAERSPLVSAIFAIFRALTQQAPGLKTAQIEFPYVDALRVQTNLGSGAHFLQELAKIFP